MEEMSDIIYNLKKIGLNEYESKAYLKLLEDYPINGYNLSKISKVPRSRIYDVLNSLVEKQFVYEIKRRKKILFLFHLIQNY